MRKRQLIRISAIISAISGMVILAGVIYPIASYEISSRQKYPTLLSPLADNYTLSSFYKTDYTKASNWFSGDGSKVLGANNNLGVQFYTITIPKLKIDKAQVELGGEDLSNHLVQYRGTNLPGKNGNAVIFGHSILPQFYDPKNYMSIFSTLPTLSVGDEIFVDYDGIHYTYRVENLYEVLPTNLQVLDQTLDDSYLSLITCVPPGHPLKPRRLVVRARIVPPDL